MQMNKIFNPASDWTKKYFGKRIQKIPVDGGFSCPNRDGKLSKNGCLYCNNKSFTPFYTDNKKSITSQLDSGIKYFSKRYECDEFFAYFQTYSGTYDSVDILEKRYRTALSFPNIKGLIIATRPDCINQSVIDLLLKLRQETYIRIEIGVESFDDKVLKSINRCHDSLVAIRAIKALREVDIDVSAHLIFGLPEESRDAARDYALILSDTSANFVKLHHLQVVKGSRLAELYLANDGFIKLHTLDSYIETVASFLSFLNKNIYVERFINRVPKNLLIAPKFGDINENTFTQNLCDYMNKNALYQGIFNNSPHFLNGGSIAPSLFPTPYSLFPMP